MKKYLMQLIEDINKLLKEDPPYSLNPVPEDTIEALSEMEDHFLNDKGILVSDFTNIKTENLPAVELLSTEQISLLTEKLLELLIYYNLYPDFPESLPEFYQYKTLREHWHNFKAPLISYNYHYEFCEYDEEKCPFPGYCSSCEDVARDLENDFNSPNVKSEISELLPSKTQLRETYVLNKKEHMKSFLKNIKPDDYVGGIYNYCDRWCERCQMTDKCAQYEMLKDELDYNSQGFSNENFQDDVKACFMVTKELLEESLKEHDVVVEEIYDKDVCLDDFMPNKDHKIFSQASDYSVSASKWLREIGDYYQSEDIKMQEAIEIISYYHLFLSAKIGRALSNNFDDLEEYDMQNDQNGSAKISLIAIEKSLNAWSFLAENSAIHEDAAIQNSVMLSKLKKQIENHFPDAYKFIRPGFDS